MCIIRPSYTVKSLCGINKESKLCNFLVSFTHVTFDSVVDKVVDGRVRKWDTIIKTSNGVCLNLLPKILYVKIYKTE